MAKLKAFLKKNWLWIIITLGIVAIVAMITYLIGEKHGIEYQEKMGELTEQLKDSIIHEHWEQLNDILSKDPDHQLAIKLDNLQTGHSEWIEITYADTEPEWIQNGEGTLRDQY